MKTQFCGRGSGGEFTLIELLAPGSDQVSADGFAFANSHSEIDPWRDKFFINAPALAVVPDPNSPDVFSRQFRSTHAL
jgi:hypothetical protein